MGKRDVISKLDKRMKSPGRRPNSGEITRKRLQQAALDLFWEKGYQSTTTRDVAASLGVQQASLYYHMKNKEDLLHGICYSSLLRVIEEVETAARRASNARDAIRQMTRAHLATTLEYQKEFSVALMECRELGADYRAEIEALWSRYFMFAYEVLDIAKTRGLVRNDIANKYIYTPLLSTLNWASLWYRPSSGLTVPELDALFNTVFFEGAAAFDCRRSRNIHAACGGLELLADPIGCVGSNETYARMLDTACALFARKGYFATSIREIADAMSIQKASLYYYISSKEDLIYEISKSAMEHLSANVQAALSQVSSPEERLYAFILSHVVSLLQHQNWHAAANEEITHSFSPARRREIVAMRDAYEVLARGILAEAQQAGILRSDISPKFLGLILLGMITNIYPWYQPGVDIPAADLALTLADVYVSGIVPRSLLE